MAVRETMTPAERIDAAIALQPVDRVPVVPMMDFYCAHQKGVPVSKFITNGDLGRDVLEEIFIEYGGWDATFFGTTLNEFAWTLTLLAPLKVPGRELPENEQWQFDEREVMKPEDYDFIIENGWQPFWSAMFPRIRPHTPSHEVPTYLQAWFDQAIRDTLKWERKGILSFTGVASVPPLELFSVARSIKEFSFDLFRRPDKVLAASDKIADDISQAVINGMRTIKQGTQRGYRTAFLAGTRATFLSPRYFDRFAWPYIKRQALAYIDAGITPLLHFDSNWVPYLDRFFELPRGKAVLELDSQTNIFKAKEVLGDHLCIMGDVPAQLLALGTVDEVDTYVRRLIDVVGKGNGFILSTGCDCPLDAKPENVKAMIEIGKTYYPHAH
ncbi:MAG: uroporphyrinogen decarboxylase family protein [Anaerolineae bacterium]